MNNEGIFLKDNCWGKYEVLIRKEIGDKLDSLKRFIDASELKLLSRLFQVDALTQGKVVTVDQLQNANQEFRKKILAATLYNDCLYRIEAAYISICAGLLNVAYASLRSALESVKVAFLVERDDLEANNFLNNLKNKPVDKSKISKLVNSEISALLLELNSYYSDIGVHSRFGAIQLSSVFGYNRLNKRRASSSKATVDSLTLPE